MTDTATTIDWPLVYDWIEALENGDYEQTRRCLRKGEAHCATGVVYDLLDPGGWAPSPIDPDRYYHRCLRTPAAVGLSCNEWHQLQDLNDDGASFAAIAALLREWYGLVD